VTDPSAATPAGGSVIHDLGYRPYTGPRLGPGAIARALTLTGFRNAFGLGRSGRSKVLPFVLLVEVLGDDAQTRMTAALTAAGVTTATRGGMVTVDATDRPDAVRDLVRDTAADLGLGLVRLQVDHRRIEDVFADGAPASRPDQEVTHD
jgi:hypothetical protein